MAQKESQVARSYYFYRSVIYENTEPHLVGFDDAFGRGSFQSDRLELECPDTNVSDVQYRFAADAMYETLSPGDIFYYEDFSVPSMYVKFASASDVLIIRAWSYPTNPINVNVVQPVEVKPEQSTIVDSVIEQARPMPNVMTRPGLTTINKQAPAFKWKPNP